MDEKLIASDTSTELARERTREAADRTLMAWIRTSLTLISFGFGVGKVFEVLAATFPAKHLDPLRASFVFAISLIILGVLSLLGAIIQYGQMLMRLKQAPFAYKAPHSLTVGVAILLLVIALFSLVAIIVR